MDIDVDIDVDEIADVNYLGTSGPNGVEGVEVRFKDGTTRLYQGEELPEVFAILNHWTPPTA